MAGSVTVTGGTNNPQQTIDYTDGDLIGTVSADAAQDIDASSSGSPSQIYAPGQIDTSGYVIVPASQTGASITATGAEAITVDDGAEVTIRGGGSGSEQVVLAGTAGLNFSATSGAVYIAVGGGDNNISLSGDMSPVVIATGNGNDEITGGDASNYTDGSGTHPGSYIDAGLGNNTITTGSGSSYIVSEGDDTINFGSGQTTVFGLSGSQYARTDFRDVVGSVSIISNNTTIEGQEIFGNDADFEYVDAGNHNTINTGNGNDTIYAGESDTVNAGDGNNVIVANSGTTINKDQALTPSTQSKVILRTT